MNAFAGMTSRKAVNMVAKMIRHAKRWDTTEACKNDALQLVNDAITDDSVHISTRIKAVDCLLKMEQQNQIDERILLGVNEDAGRQPQVVLLLPTNNTEVMPDTAADDPDTAADDPDAAAGDSDAAADVCATAEVSE